jgi:hypothetical protein
MRPEDLSCQMGQVRDKKSHMLARRLVQGEGKKKKQKKAEVSIVGQLCVVDLSFGGSGYGHCTTVTRMATASAYPSQPARMVASSSAKSSHSIE